MHSLQVGQDEAGFADPLFGPDADREHPGSLGRLYSGCSIFDYDAGFRRNSQLLGCIKKQVRCRFRAPYTVPVGQYVNCAKQAQPAGDFPGVLASGGDGHHQPRCADVCQELPRPRKDFVRGHLSDLVQVVAVFALHPP